MSALNIVFGGTPEFAVPALEALYSAGHRIAAVYTQPDRPAGRGQKMHTSAVKECALRHGLHIEQPATLRVPEAAQRLASFRPDVMIVVAYGLILPQTILDVPRLGCVNIHASLLPRWRGAAPIQRALLAGDATTGVTIMRMDAGLDTGPMLSMHPTPIAARENAVSLSDRLAALGAQAMVETLAKYAAGKLYPQVQMETGVTYAHKIKKEEAHIDWTQSATKIDAQVRAFNPWPIAETRWRDQQLRVWEALPLVSTYDSPPGTIVSATTSGIVVAAGEGALCIERLQMAGRKAMSAADFINAQRIVGERFA
ncbi:MAG TPA: methionyl-tRNA formyltransferase [Steroidobacteraceae bacterium]|nr:methionyl-tRNA formyltransferase [Steroidobacteraceae bacterium]